MGFFDFITNLFSKSDKDIPKKKKQPAVKSKPTSASKKKTTRTPTGDTASESFHIEAKKVKGNKRKKSEQVHAAPIDEKALGFSISLKGEDEQSKKRNAVRIKVDNLFVHITRLNKKFPVTDISATGLGFAFEKPHIKGGVNLEMDLYLDGKLKSKALLCKTMRHERGSVGCVFIELDRAQDDAVHEVVLLGQKQQADRKHAQKDREFSLPQ